jgi:hypothetical protein
MKRARLVPTALALALFALGPSAAGADTVADGRTTFEIAPGLSRALDKQDAKLFALKPGWGGRNTLNLPLGGGRLERSGSGSLRLEGGLEFTGRGRRASFRGLVLDTAHRALSASFSGRRVRLATVGSVSRSRTGFAAVLALKRLTLTGAGAAAIDSSLGVADLLDGGQRLGSATVVARLEQLSLIDGRAYLSFAQGLGEKLKALKIETEPVGGGWLHGTSPPIPVVADTSGSVAIDLSSGSFASEDGFSLSQEGTTRKLTVRDVEFDLDAHILRAAIEPRPAAADQAGVVDLASFELPVVHKNAYTGEISTPNSPALLSAGFASALNQAFADPSGMPGLFAAGEPFGELAIGVKTHGPPRG